MTTVEEQWQPADGDDGVIYVTFNDLGVATITREAFAMLCTKAGFERTRLENHGDHPVTAEPDAGDVGVLAGHAYEHFDACDTHMGRCYLEADVLALFAEVRRETAERIAQAIEGSIEAHRNAGSSRAVLASLAPLPALVRSQS